MNEKKQVDIVLNEVLKHFNMTEAMLKTQRRFQELVVPRQMFCYFAWKYSNVSLRSIGIIVGGMNHSTVIHSRKIVETRIELEPAFRKHFDEIKTQILARTRTLFSIDMTVSDEFVNTQRITPSNERHCATL